MKFLFFKILCKGNDLIKTEKYFFNCFFWGVQLQLVNALEPPFFVCVLAGLPKT